MKVATALAILVAIPVTAHAGTVKTPTVSVPHVNAPRGTVTTHTLNIGSQSSGAGAGKVTFNPFQITRKVDSASPKLYEATTTGKHIPKATITLRKNDEETPKENVNFNYGAIQYQYK